MAGGDCKIHAGVAQHWDDHIYHEQWRERSAGLDPGVRKRDQYHDECGPRSNPSKLVTNFIYMLRAVALPEFFSFYAGDDTHIKWPNDLYCRTERKGGF